MLAVAVFALDRLTKGLVVARVPLGTEIPAVDHVVFITHIQNQGAAFGMAPLLSSLFLLASVVVAIALIAYVTRRQGTLFIDAMLGLILGGTAGNGFDRVLHGSVTDFIALHFWPIFNLADSAITLGVAAILVAYALRRRRGV